MTSPIRITFAPLTTDALATTEGRIAIFVTEDGKMDIGARKVNTLSRKAIDRLVASDRFAKLGTGDLAEITWPVGVAAEALLVVKLPRRATAEEHRKAGASIAKALGKGDLTILAAAVNKPEDLAFGIAMRAYVFQDHKTGDKTTYGTVTVMVKDADETTAAYAPLAAVAEGTFFTRDLVNAPANILTTTSFAEKLNDLSALGVTVEVLEEADLEKLGMGSLLCVGQGSDSPSKVVVMQWNGGGDEAPFAFVGKGVVFDTGGISIKPAAGMEDMTMDMGGAGVVAGVMKTLALRKAKANVVGLVGLVENMPSGN
ncbi:MAG: leucyl aminopeptidase, partial [Marivivens sp.]|nr:leucyl aminopeptidase [Marivivens sp.]